MSEPETASQADARLAERLLRGGIAPRHVQRCLRELRDHRLDLMDQLQQQGLQPDEAADEAQLRLGHRDTLAVQMLDRPELRSRARRFAWLLFGVAPLFATLMLSLAVLATAVVIGEDTLPIAQLCMRWMVPASIGIFLGVVALRRRMPPAWPVTGIALTALISGATLMEPHLIAIGIPDTSRTLWLACGLLIAYALASMAIWPDRLADT